MKKLSEFYQRLNHARQVFLLAAAVVLSMAALCDDCDGCIRIAPAHVRAECG